MACHCAPLLSYILSNSHCGTCRKKKEAGGSCERVVDSGKAPLQELERVLSSLLCLQQGLSWLLRFLVERQLEGREGELKESLIGVEVYSRKPDYDPKLDSTVRREMARLRARALPFG